ncbi:MAG: sugar phosphate isomerase/epimerase [Planctomycetales bacterium]|nr:sugar phosphate isomerase/epimerase [Planctomycetales bacterium]
MAASYLTRRHLLRTTASAMAAGWLAPSWGRANENVRSAAGMTLGFSTYGMKSLPVEQALAAIAEIGYDAVEIAARADWDSAPANMPPARRQACRGLLADRGLRLSSLMEHLPPAADDAQHARDLERLAGVAELGADLAPERPPLIQTVLGGGAWEEKNSMFRDRLGDWLAVCRPRNAVLAIKPHRGGALSEPSEAVWLIEQLGAGKWLKMVYDYSHYAFRNLPLADTVETALPHTAHIAVKDAVEENGRVVFQLPGASGAFDYASLLRLFHAGGYQGDISCEVSGMVSGNPGYDPLAAARQCYKNLAPAFAAAGIRREK